LNNHVLLVTMRLVRLQNELLTAALGTALWSKITDHTDVKH